MLNPGSVIEMGQQAAAQAMTDLCVVRRPGEGGDPDPETGFQTGSWADPDPVYAGVWKRQLRSLVPTNPDVAGESVETERMEGHWPIPDALGDDGFPVFQTGDVVFWAVRDDAGEVVVPEGAARAWRITAVPDKTFRTAVRLPVEVHSWR